MSSGKDALQMVPLHLPHPILGGPPRPSRREARPCERGIENFRGLNSTQHAAVLGAIKDTPAFGGGCAILDVPCARQQPYLCKSDGGMTSAEQRNGWWPLYLQGEHNCG